MGKKDTGRRQSIVERTFSKTNNKQPSKTPKSPKKQDMLTPMQRRRRAQQHFRASVLAVIVAAVLKRNAKQKERGIKSPTRLGFFVSNSSNDRPPTATKKESSPFFGGLESRPGSGQDEKGKKLGENKHKPNRRSSLVIAAA